MKTMPGLLARAKALKEEESATVLNLGNKGRLTEESKDAEK